MASLVRAVALLSCAATGVRAGSWLTQTRDQRWVPATETVGMAATMMVDQGPQPTTGPDLVNRQDQKPLVTQCGTNYLFTDSRVPWAHCASGSFCTADGLRRAVGCCAEENDGVCDLPAACLDKTDSDRFDPQDSRTMFCGNRDAPYCLTMSFQKDGTYGNYNMFKCDEDKGKTIIVDYQSDYPKPGDKISSTSTSSTTGNDPSTTTDSDPGETSTTDPPSTPSSSSGGSSAPVPTGSQDEDSDGGSGSGGEEDDDDDGDSSKTGAIAGGVVGSLAGIGVIVGLVFFAMWYRKRNEQRAGGGMDRGFDDSAGDLVNRGFGGPPSRMGLTAAPVYSPGDYHYPHGHQQYGSYSSSNFKPALYESGSEPIPMGQVSPPPTVSAVPVSAVPTERPQSPSQTVSPITPATTMTNATIAPPSEFYTTPPHHPPMPPMPREPPPIWAGEKAPDVYHTPAAAALIARETASTQPPHQLQSELVQEEREKEAEEEKKDGGDRDSYRAQAPVSSIPDRPPFLDVDIVSPVAPSLLGDDIASSLGGISGASSLRDMGDEEGTEGETAMPAATYGVAQKASRVGSAQFGSPGGVVIMTGPRSESRQQQHSRMGSIGEEERRRAAAVDAAGTGETTNNPEGGDARASVVEYNRFNPPPPQQFKAYRPYPGT